MVIFTGVYFWHARNQVALPYAVGQKIGAFTVKEVSPATETYKGGQIADDNFVALFEGTTTIQGIVIFSEFGGDYVFVPDTESLALLPSTPEVVSIRTLANDDSFTFLKSVSDKKIVVSLELFNYRFASVPSDASGASADFRLNK